MNKLVQAIQSSPSTTLTENSAVTFTSTTSKVLDLFSRGAALRTRTDAEVVSLFSDAYYENKLLALKCLFYIRDVRGGQGERKTFRTCLKWLSTVDFPAVLANIDNIANYGRYDDILCLLDTHEVEIAEYLRKTLAADVLLAMSGKSTSLLAKWMPSVNTSSAETRMQAKKLVRLFGCSDKEYRKTLSQLRAAINIVESKMCAKDWDSIEFSKVPSRASMIYKKAFRRHGESRYDAWLQAVEKGEAKINASTLFPYDLVREAMKYYGGWKVEADVQSAIKTIDLQWKNLPNYLEKNPHNGLVVADVSGSMSGLPIQVSISLAIYFAERNIGTFKDCFITFSGNPTLQKIEGSNIVEKVENLNSAEWEMNTNLQAVFDLILRAAKKDKVPAKDMPETIFIISDMEFDSACGGTQTNFEAIEKKYAESGYKIPTICFWNVDSRNDQSPVTKNQQGVTLVSGCSPSIFKSVMSGETITPYDFMLEVLNSNRYNKVVV